MSRSMYYFDLLTQAEQETAIRRLVESGMNEYTVASVTRLSVEMIRQILARTEAGTVPAKYSANDRDRT